MTPRDLCLQYVPEIINSFVVSVLLICSYCQMVYYVDCMRKQEMNSLFFSCLQCSTISEFFLNFVSKFLTLKIITTQKCILHTNNKAKAIHFPMPHSSTEDCVI